MKKLITICIILLSINSYSQITLDFQTSLWYLGPIKLSDSETKYFDANQWTINHQNQFSLYNLDGTLYKTIVMPPKPDTSSFVYTIYHISRTLFDNDASNIEYLVEYQYDSVSPLYHYLRTKVVREDGSILLDELNAEYNWVFSTEEGTKLMLYYTYAIGYSYQKKLFNLPGVIPTNTKENINYPNDPLTLYPNPNSGSFFIKLHSNEGKENIIDLYSTNGNLLETYKSKNSLFQINNFGLSDGVYLLNNRFENKRSTTRMIIKK